MPEIAVTKCQGTGNDFVLLDQRLDNAREALPFASLARAICDRRFGVGADGLLVLLPAAHAGVDAAMRIFNADGSEAEMCGNGIRCVARYIARESGVERDLAIGTAAGTIRTEPAANGAVRVNMGVPSLRRPSETAFAFDGRSFRFTHVSLGNPHAVVFVDEAIEAFPLDELATAIANLAIADGGINVELAIVSGQRARIRIHERGVGETWACGTGACAVAVAAILNGRTVSPVEVVTRGGAVSVTWSGPGTPCFLTGAASIVFDTHFELPEGPIAASR